MRKQKSVLGRIYKKVENLLSVRAKTVIGSLMVVTLGSLSYLASQPKDVAAPTIMLTSLTRGGGTGVIVSSSKNESKVLTNGHVCEILTDGGVAITTSGERHTVAELVFYNYHDLCLVTVKAYLGEPAEVAGDSTPNYGTAVVSGHPRLLPNVISTGHFSSHQIINVWMGTKPCTKEQLDSQKKIGKFCRFFRYVPVIKTFEARLVTAPTMPGSSGSAIYDSSGDLSALVFAGNGVTTFAVPYEYIVDFLSNPYKSSNKSVIPGYYLDVEYKINNQSNKIIRQELLAKCSETKEESIKEVCETILRDLEWRNDEGNISSSINILPSNSCISKL